MKNYVLIFALVILLPFCVSAQKKRAALKHRTVKCAEPKIKAYRAWDSFNNETLAYLKYNFHDRRAAYIGKPFKTLYNDWEIKPVDYVPRIDWLHDVSKSNAAYVYFRKKFNFRPKANYNEANRILDSLILYIEFSEYHNSEIDYNLHNKYSGWNYEISALYENFIIKDLSMMNYVVPYPAPRGDEEPNYRRWER